MASAHERVHATRTSNRWSSTMKNLCTLLWIAIATVTFAQQQSDMPSPAQQIASAVLPLPENMRAEAGVRGYGRDLKPLMLRESKNHLICVGQKPGKKVFDVRCYHESFLPVVDRMRNLFGEGMKPDEVF